ncbi:conserved Plasmodium protein, unknown function [Plasmodium knowlesi strain H]|uniref:Uncharacterized protein n=3 Tax=Plasmodium knowlesi TaxID=5850 RepID=A0A5K1UYG5_PLAKH|nr:conserved Plasmodium protein, unknown function [Plasmodium knowlesi strain H]OTN65922.1 Uncharacterized protein PKNOH_S100029200 [Plasmodium knowlesi]CAA9987657.1 conserved Plasmodium protein, unknown function [Plasmodium knowlesi strain H]SBO26870.1 conserved Plasmodium protein, unknown function [Plasmodium knowlesi strain H]SBO29665.1 conserved Plasmodium protein, unknown function [Plasmodium knowlesi strain H]VVS77131.1 conserved Plasmodium protein, unknown function [Plasmodium knowlesi |eukprot:XP_002258655.1 hypothetical protein, conserved in Plasmodium species [Plasmodium knowlesi strain H]
MLLLNASARIRYVVNLTLFFFITKIVICILCKHNSALRSSNFFRHKSKKIFHVDLVPSEKRIPKCAAFIYFNSPYKKIDATEKEYKLNDDLKNIILLFGRIAEPYYPKTAEQFNFNKEPYSKYIHTGENSSCTKWKYVFKDHKKINKTIFHEKICQLKFKWPINQDENITENNFYNFVIERCLNNINIVKNNIHHLKLLLSKAIESKKEYTGRGDKEGTPAEEQKKLFLHNLYDELEKEFFNGNEDIEQGEKPNSGLQGDPLERDKRRRKILEKLENLHLNDIFKQHNRSYTRLLVNEIFNKEYPSKKTTDLFLHLLFQSNVEEFSYEHFITCLNRLGKKIELFTCNYNSNIHFDHFLFLMKNEFKKNSIQLKKKKASSAKIAKAKKDYGNDPRKSLTAQRNKTRLIQHRHNSVAECAKKKKKQNSLIIQHDAISNQLNDTQCNVKNRDHLHQLQGLDTRQANFIAPPTLNNEENVKERKNIHTDGMQTNSQTMGTNLKSTVIRLFNYIVNSIKKMAPNG